MPPKESATDVSVSVKPADASLVNLSKVRAALEKSVATGPNVTVSVHVPAPITLPAVQARLALAVSGVVRPKVVAKTMALNALIKEGFMSCFRRGGRGCAGNYKVFRALLLAAF